MATTWRIAYDPGGGEVNVDFDIEETEQARIRTNCPEDVQTFKNGLSRVYSGPVSWRSGSLTFRQIAGTLAKIRTIAALKVAIKIYYKYHITTTTYIYAHIVPEKTEKYLAGALSIEDITINWVETEEP
jgi:hypothetical protein